MNGSKTIKTISSHRIELMHFVGWFRFFLCLNDLIDPLAQNLIFVAKLLFLLLDKRVVRSAITLVGLRNCGNCPDD